MLNKKYTKVMIYVVFFTVACLLHLYLTAPVEAIAQRLVHEISKQSRDTISIKYNKVSSYGLLGIALQQVNIRYVPPNEDALVVDFNTLKVRVNFLQLLLFRLNLKTTILLGDGVANIYTTLRQGEITRIWLELNDVAISALPLVAKYIGLPVDGHINGSLQLNMDTDMVHATGESQLTLTALKIGPGAVLGLTLPVIDLGKISLPMQLKDGRLKIGPLQQKGGDLLLQMTSNLQVKSVWQNSLIDVCLHGRADTSFLDKNPTLKAALQLAETQCFKDNDGFLNIGATGPLLQLQKRPGACRIAE